MPESFGYILRNRPYRESSRLIDVFSQTDGRITCIARPAHKRGKIMAGTLEPFRYLQLQWVGRGEVFTLRQADEWGRHEIAAKELLKGIYLNELILKLCEQHYPLSSLFQAYKQTLHRITEPSTNPQALMRFELFLLEALGYEINLYQTDDHGEDISTPNHYLYLPQQGLIKKDSCIITQPDGFPLSATLLIALRDLSGMEEADWKELRVFLDRLFTYLVGRPLHSRKLLQC